MSDPKDIIRVTRVIEYRGRRGWVEQILRNSLSGAFTVGDRGSIRETARSEPEIVQVPMDNLMPPTVQDMDWRFRQAAALKGCSWSNPSTGGADAEG